ncbi:MAG: DNA-binding response regulator, partial [Chloroflexi bacterium]
EVVLMDLQLADSSYDGIQATALIRTRFPHIRVIILTSFCEKSLIEQALQAGAVGFLMKDVSMADLARAIREASPDHLVLAQQATQVMLKPAASPVFLDGKPLTPRQKEVLSLLVIGYSNREIAQKLNVRLPTARFHVSSILAKLGAANRAEASVIAVRQRLLESD